MGPFDVFLKGTVWDVYPVNPSSGKLEVDMLTVG